MEGYIFDLGKRVPDKFSQIIKEMEQYLGTTYSDIFQPAIMTETLAALPDPEMPNILDSGIYKPKIYVEKNYLNKRNIYKYIYQKMRKKYV